MRATEISYIEWFKRQEFFENPFGQNPKSLKSAVVVIFKNSPCLARDIFPFIRHFHEA